MWLQFWVGSQRMREFLDAKCGSSQSQVEQEDSVQSSAVEDVDCILSSWSGQLYESSCRSGLCGWQRGDAYDAWKVDGTQQTAIVRRSAKSFGQCPLTRLEPGLGQDCLTPEPLGRAM
ncbi:hypothetical protein C0Q70_15575 [Pomacea canaliculata]|uniref:Uncharacterized protein n=1 Tax=Pomacea canaliculata TaxID=400727 RepID=A0A2T7NV72_POMCA|nr:hypothetical protein C0Q70_15575 [Pomacea canaliculata]